MELFHRIDDGRAIVRNKSGVFKQVDLFRRGDELYVAHAGGFARVMGRDGRTTVPTLTVVDYAIPDAAGIAVVHDALGWPKITDDPVRARRAERQSARV